MDMELRFFCVIVICVCFVACVGFISNAAIKINQAQHGVVEK